MMSSALVSVIIPCYNQGKYLAEAIESALNQTYPHVEVIVVNDGSTDNTAEVAARYAGRIIYAEQENAGASVARNRGILATAGELIAFLDADDYWYQTKLEKQVSVLKADPSIGLVHTGFRYIYESGADSEPGYTGYCEDYHALLGGCGINSCTVVFRRRLLPEAGLFDPLLVRGEDWELWLRVSRATRLWKIEEELAVYRRHDSNVSSDYGKMLPDHLHVIERHKHAAAIRGDKRTIMAAEAGKRRAYDLYGCQAYDEARSALRQRDLSRFIRHLLNALKLNPRFTLVALLCWLSERKHGSS